MLTLLAALMLLLLNMLVTPANIYIHVPKHWEHLINELTMYPTDGEYYMNPNSAWKHIQCGSWPRVSHLVRFT